MIRLLVVAGLVAGLAGCEKAPKQELTSEEKVRLACVSDMAGKMKQFDAQMAKGETDAALSGMFHCEAHVADAAFKERIRVAHVTQMSAQLDDPKFELDRKKIVLERLAKYDTALHRKYQADWAKIEKIGLRDQEMRRAAARAEEVRAAKIRKSQGVSIGMTKADVLASSWGRPNHINTTTSAYGVREQWVYGGRNYLYFNDGILTTIQN